MVRKCGECIHLGLPYTLRCQLSDERSRACRDIETRASFLVDGGDPLEKEPKPPTVTNL